MKIAVFVFSNFPPPVHGVSAYSLAISEKLKSRGYRVVQVSLGTRGDFSSIEKFRIGKVLGDLVAIISAFVRALVLRAQGWRVFLYFTPSQYGAAALRDSVVAVFGKYVFHRVVGHLHGCRWHDSASKPGVVAKAMKLAAHSSDLYIALGESYAKELASQRLVKTLGVNNGTDVHLSFVKQRSLQKDRIRLLFLSNLLRSKGLWLAAEAAKQLWIQGHHVELVCAGTWVYEDEKRQFYDEFRDPLDNGVISIFGFANAEKKETLLKESDFLVLPIPNAFEGQPLSIIEAMAFGLLPIVTPNGGIPDLFRFEGGQLLCSAAHSKPDGIVQTILSFAERRYDFDRVSQACLDHQRNQLSASLSHDQVIRQILGQGSEPQVTSI